MRRENYLSDLKVEVTLKLGGTPIAVPEHDFELRFMAGDNTWVYVCGRRNGEWVKCEPTADMSKLVCYLDNHGLGIGRLRCLYVDYSPDSEMPDGNMRKAVPTDLDIELVDEAGDDAMSVDGVVVVSVETLLGEVRALKSDLERKRASGYWKGDPGAPGVGISSVVQTTTSHESEGENIVTVTLTDGRQSQFSVFNGEAGGGGGVEQKQADWNQADSGEVDYIKNKPTIPAAQIQSDWSQADDTKADYVKNKPSLATVATSGNYSDLSGKPSIPAAQIQSDWSQSDDSEIDYIKNKPTIPVVPTTVSSFTNDANYATTSAVSTAVTNICPIIEDTRSSSVAAITGVAPFASLVGGQRILLHFKYRNEASPTLQLTLSDNTTTAAIPMYQNYNSGVGALTVQAMPAGSYGEFVYDATNNRWMLVGKDVNTTYSNTSQSDINNSAQGSRLIEPKLLRDNFYLKSETNTLLSNYCPIIEDTRTSAGATITGVAPFNTLTDKQRIVIHFGKTTANNGSIQLTLASGETTDNIPAYTVKFSAANLRRLPTRMATYDFDNGDYAEFIYDSTGNIWTCISQVDTAPYKMYQGVINAGTSEEGYSISPKLLRDNFYLKSEVDNAKQSKRTFEDNPYVIVDVVIDYNDGGITQSSLSDGLDQYYDGWDDDPINTAAMNTICADLSAHTIEGVVMRRRLSSALQSTLSDIDAETADGGGSLNIVKLFLDANKYIDIGNRNSLALALPTKVTETDGFALTVSGGDSFDLDLASYVETEGGSETDLLFLQHIIDEQIAAGGAQNTYDISESAYAVFVNLCSYEDFYDAAPLEVSKTSKQVSLVMPDYTRADEFLITFTCNSDNSALTLPTGVNYGSGLDFDNDKKEGRRFQLSIQDNIALYTYVD